MILDGTPKLQEAIKSEVVKTIKDLEPDVSHRKSAYRIRRDMFEGKHHKYTNIPGLTNKEKEGHISAVFNYVSKMGRTVVRKSVGGSFKFRVVEEDASNEIESVRAEGVENWISKVLRDNKFEKSILKRGATVQVRDADFALKCYVVENPDGSREIKIDLVDDMEKLYVQWDDASGREFSKIAYIDFWSETKVLREFPNVDLNDVPARSEVKGTAVGEHGDEYAADTDGEKFSTKNLSPGYKGKNKKHQIVDYWGWHDIEDKFGIKEFKPINMVLLGTGEDAQILQFVITEYRKLPWFIGHSYPNPGKPWSSAFIDNLFDANIELNDRTGEEGDMIRAGANKKYVAFNMSDFDAQSLSNNTGQVIFIEGEDADFRQLQDSTNTFPSESYKNSVMEHLFNLGIPQVALAAGSGPYTGRAGAIQYQPVADIVGDLRDEWDVVLYDLFEMIQWYGIDYFPEVRDLFTISEWDGEGNYYDVGIGPRRVELDWDNPIPLAQSDAVVDAATMFDRKALPLKRFLEMGGFSDVNAVIKELKAEARDPELAGIRVGPDELTESVQTRMQEIQGRREGLDMQEQVDLQAGATPEKPPVLGGRTSGRGVSSAENSPSTGQSAGGAARQAQQNLNAQRGV